MSARISTKASLQNLGHRYAAVRENAVDALARRKGGVIAISGLLQTLEHGHECAREAAARSLAKIGVKAVPEVVKLLKHGSPHVRLAAAYTFGEMGQKAISAKKELEEALQDKDLKVREAAEFALKEMEK